MRTLLEARTVTRFADEVGVSRSLVRKWVAQGRLTTAKPGGELLILDDNRPEPAPQGGLHPYQRKVWPKKSKPRKTKG